MKKLLILVIIASSLIVYNHIHATSVIDDFEIYTDNNVLADTDCYTHANFPGAGSDDGTCLSDNWEMDNGQLEAQEDSGGNMWGFINDLGDIFRINTQQTAQNPIVTWKYKAAGTSNAVDVWLHFQTQYWLYIVQFDRSDNCIIAKRKVPTNTNASNEWGGDVIGGHGAEIANLGVYYNLLLDDDAPAHGSTCGVVGTGIDYVDHLATSTVTHDGSLDAGTVWMFKTTITTIPAATCGKAFDCTQLQLFRGGELVASWTDDNSAKNFNGTRTIQGDCDEGWFTTVTGYTADWCKPITAAGKSGFRNDDDIDVWIDDFSMTEAGSGEEEEPTTPNVAVGSAILRIGQAALNIGADEIIAPE